MFNETAGSGDRSADLTPELADSLCVAFGGNSNASTTRRSLSSGGLGGHRHMDSQPEAEG
jgi:hypothetical protein